MSENFDELAKLFRESVEEEKRKDYESAKAVHDVVYLLSITLDPTYFVNEVLRVQNFLTKEENEAKAIYSKAYNEGSDIEAAKLKMYRALVPISVQQKEEMLKVVTEFIRLQTAINSNLTVIKTFLQFYSKAFSDSFSDLSDFLAKAENNAKDTGD